MNWFITHMVAPKEKAVSCQECHSRSPDSRLAAITDLYLPGRDRNVWVDRIGWLLVAAALAAGLLHGLFRLINRFRRNAA